METYQDILMGYIELEKARKTKKRFQAYKKKSAGSWTKSKERSAINRYRMVANNKILQEEVEKGRVLRKRSGEEWAEVLVSVPEPYRSRVATLIWWDFPLPEIKKFISTDLVLADEIGEEEIAIWLYECGYSASKAIVRSKTQENL